MEALVVASKGLVDRGIAPASKGYLVSAVYDGPMLREILRADSHITQQIEKESHVA